MIKLFTLISLLVSFEINAQAPFSGKLVYKETILGKENANKDSSNFITILCNDSLSRTETMSQQIGKQVYIEHLRLRKGYLLLYFQDKKFAIQKIDSSSSQTQYSFKRKFGKKTIQGLKCKKVLVSHPNLEKPVLMYYAPTIDGKYNKAIQGIKGLPVDYYLMRSDGLVHYQLVSIMNYVPEYNLFGVPSDFKKVSFDEFMEQMDIK